MNDEQSNKPLEVQVSEAAMDLLSKCIAGAHDD
jgi:hypothetical protein